jgi:hypothetical protein
MTDQNLQIKKFAEALTRLVEFVPTSNDELKQWYEESWQFKAEHLKGGEDFLKVPHFLWHYLSDADIRMKSEAYAKMQNHRINLLLEYLKRGVLPSDKDI